MAQTISVPGVGDLEFPDDMSQADMAAAIKKNFPEIHNAPAQQPTGQFGTGGSVEDIPGMAAPIVRQAAPQRSFADRAIGAGEAALTMGTGATSGLVGNIAGSLSGIGKSVLGGTFGTNEGAEAAAEEAASTAKNLTYQPRTEAGQQYVQNIGETLSPLAGLSPFTQEAAIIGSSAKAAIPQVRNAPSALSGMAKRNALPESKSMGAAEVEAATRRREMAAQLPVDPKLTEGQATRNYNQQRFEQEAMKGELGEPLRQRAAQQHQALQQSLDSWLDDTGAQAPDIRATGIAIDKAIREKSLADKSRVREAYRRAEASGELAQPISNTAVSGLVSRRTTVQRLFHY